MPSPSRWLCSTLLVAACGGTLASASTPPDASADDVADVAAPRDAEFGACPEDAAGQTCPLEIVGELGCPATLEEVPFARWCALVPFRVGKWPAPCGGLAAVSVGRGIDSEIIYFFDAVTDRLVMITVGALKQDCIYGTGRIPEECLAVDTVRWQTMCASAPDAGLHDAPDGANADAGEGD